MLSIEILLVPDMWLDTRGIMRERKQDEKPNLINEELVNHLHFQVFTATAVPTLVYHVSLYRDHGALGEFGVP